MPGLFTEDTYEQAIIELFENMGYDHIYAPDFDRDYTSPLMDSVLRDSLVRVNRGLPVDAIEEAINKLRTFDTGSLLQKNMTFMDYLQNGITVKFFVNGEEQATIVKLVDYEKIDNNTFYVVNQYTFVENGNNRRPDIILFINGMPLVLMELKSPSKDEVGVENAYKQIRNYIKDIPSLFYYNAICVISDLSSNKAGTITSGLDRFMDWKCKDGSKEESGFAEFETFYEGMFQKKRLLDILKNFILFSGTGTGRFKVLAGYHQYFAVRKAIERAKIATRTDGKGGVFWHTQGSGKSLSMVFYAHLLQEALDSPTIVVLIWTISSMHSFLSVQISSDRLLFRRRVRNILSHSLMAEVQMVLFSQLCSSLSEVRNLFQNAETLWLWRMRPIVVSMDLRRRL